MKCGWVKRNIFRFLEGQLKPQKEARVEEHLQDCKDCFTSLKAAQLVLEALQNSKQVDVPIDFNLSVKRKIIASATEHPRTSPAKKGAGIWNPVRVVSIAGIMLMILLLILANPLGNSDLNLTAARRNSNQQTLIPQTAQPAQQTPIDSYPMAQIDHNILQDEKNLQRTIQRFKQIAEQLENSKNQRLIINNPYDQRAEAASYK